MGYLQIYPPNLKNLALCLCWSKIKFDLFSNFENETSLFAIRLKRRNSCFFTVEIFYFSFKCRSSEVLGKTNNDNQRNKHDEDEQNITENGGENSTSRFDSIEKLVMGPQSQTKQDQGLNRFNNASNASTGGKGNKG
jgi:hypothetical protein